MTPLTLVNILLVVVLITSTGIAFLLRQRTHELRILQTRFSGVIDADAERNEILEELAHTQATVREAIERQKHIAAQEISEEKQLVITERKRVIKEIMEAQATAREAIEQQKADAERALTDHHRLLEISLTEGKQLEERIALLQAEFQALDEVSHLQSFGFYKPHFDFSDSARYQDESDRVREPQKVMLKEKAAAVCATEWTVSGSKVEGRKQTNQTIKLMLRAFNGESDAAIAKVKYNNIQVMEARIQKANEVINSLGSVMQCRIVDAFVALKMAELRLAHEYQEKIQREKEDERRIRVEKREEEKAQRELEKARDEAELEELRYQEALAKAREEVEHAVGAKQERLLTQIAEMQRRLEEAQANKQRAISRAEMTRSGYVYVISNEGSFGSNVFKVGMTRRLDPMERIRELGDASVPFQFDVHAMIYSEDAPTLEASLHRAFGHRRINRINERREFFRIALDEIAEVVKQSHTDIEFIRLAKAEDYRKTLALIAEEESSVSKM